MPARRAFLILPAALAACGAAAAETPSAEPPAEPPAATARDRGVLQTRPGFRDAVSAPLEDLNLKKTDIPDVLARARADPYALAGLDRCEALAAEIGRIDAVLGPDLDEPPPPEARSRLDRAASAAHGAAVGEVRDRTRGLLPFRSWIRRLTGADRNARDLQAAVQAGQVRRGYLKGAGMRMNCAPPAAPSWFVPAPPPEPVVQDAAAPAGAAAPAWTLWLRAVVDWLRRLLAALGL